jgi:hypothetical protein
MMGAPEKVKEALAASVPFRSVSKPARIRISLEMIRNPYFNGEDVRLTVLFAWACAEAGRRIFVDLCGFW